MDIPVIYSDDYTISLEVILRGKRAVTFIHADVRNWNKTTYKELQDKWKQFRKIYTNTIYAYPQEKQTTKFAEKFGFQQMGDVMRHRAEWVE